MYELARNEPTGVVRLTATAATPRELLEAALRGVLAAARGDQPPAPSVDVVSVPLRGAGPDLAQLFLDLAGDLIGQIEEFGSGLDDLRLDGLLRTDDGGYTAWGYLQSPADGTHASPLTLRVGTPEISDNGTELRLTSELHPD